MISLCFKKGDLPDMLIFLVTVFTFAIGLLVLSFVIPSIADGLYGAGLNESSGGYDAIEELSELGANGMQKGFFFLFVGLVMSTMITSFLTKTHPIFLFMYIFFLGVTVFLGGYLGNAFEQFASSPVLVDTLGSQGLISAVMQNIVIITLIVGALSMIIVFAKFSSFFGGPKQGAL
tara:strand:+ start:10075 stop:10602 length:528 start_codon:yes stop_codon:yes gene_type:complete